MEPLHFNQLIDAEPSIVFDTLTDAAYYREWTKPFSASSYYEGNWEKGATIYFMGIDENGNKTGMISRIRDLVPDKYISVEHLGWIQNGEEVLEGESVAAMKGAREDYNLTAQGGKTLLEISTDAFANMKDYFLKAWPEALERLKQICEQRSTKTRSA